MENLYKFEFDDTSVVNVCQWGNYVCATGNKVLVETIEGAKNYFKYIHINTDAIDEYLKNKELYGI